jgi:hypothetical protein
LAPGAKTTLGESELLLIIDMCNDGMERCHAREKEHLRGNNKQAAEWDRRLRDRYTYLKNEVLGELERRRRAINVQTAEGGPPQAAGKGPGEPPAR